MNYGILISKPHKDSTEVVGKRTENSKTFQNPDGTFTWGGIIGAIHYKEDYRSKTEGWKEIDTDHTVDYPDYVLYDRLPIKVKVFKNKTGYEIESRRTGHKFTVELVEVGGKAKTKHDNDNDLDFEFQIEPDRVRLWKHLKTSKTPKTFKWKVTEENHKEGLYSLAFRENPEAVEIGDKSKAVEVATKKTKVDSASFYWEETAPKTGVSIDTDVNYTVGNGADDANQNSTGGVNTTNTYIEVSYAYRWIGTRFTGVAVPKDATINSAYWSGWPISNDDPYGLSIRGDDTDDSAAFTTSSNNISGRSQTTATVDWTALNIGTDGYKNSPDIASIVGEITSRAGWSSGNDMSILMYDSDGSGAFRVHSYENTSNHPCKLTITYTASASGPANLKTFDGLAKSSVKTILGLAIASVKSVDGLT